MLCFLMQNRLVGAPGELTRLYQGPVRVCGCVPGAKEPQRTARVDFRIFCGFALENAISPKWSPNSPSTGHKQKSHTKIPTSPEYTLAVLESPILAFRSQFYSARWATHGRYFRGNDGNLEPGGRIPRIPGKSVFQCGGRPCWCMGSHL